MGVEHEGGPDDWSGIVAPDDDSTLEPEIVRWLWMYAEATQGRDDATVATILDEVNQLLRRRRTEVSTHRAEHESRLRVLSEHLPAILWTTDSELQVTSFAGGGLAQVDVQLASGISLPLADLLTMGTPSSEAMAAHVDALRGQPGVYEYDWRARSYLAHVEPLRGRDGVVEGTVGLAIDVTERKQAEEAVRATQRMLTHLLERFPNGAIGVFDTDLRYAMAAGSALEQVGLTPEYMLGKTPAELYPPALATVLEGACRRAFAGESVTVTAQLDDRTYTLSSAPLDSADGAVQSVVTVAQDITEQVRAEQERAEERERRARLEGMLFAARQLADRMKGDLAQSSGAIDLLQPQPALPPELRVAMQTVAATVADMMEKMAELERLIYPAPSEQAARPASDDQPSTPSA